MLSEKFLELRSLSDSVLGDHLAHVALYPPPLKGWLAERAIWINLIKRWSELLIRGNSDKFLFIRADVHKYVSKRGFLCIGTNLQHINGHAHPCKPKKDFAVENPSLL